MKSWIKSLITAGLITVASAGSALARNFDVVDYEIRGDKDWFTKRDAEVILGQGPQGYTLTEAAQIFTSKDRDLRLGLGVSATQQAPTLEGLTEESARRPASARLGFFGRGFGVDAGYTAARDGTVVDFGTTVGVSEYVPLPIDVFAELHRDSRERTVFELAGMDKRRIAGVSVIPYLETELSNTNSDGRWLAKFGGWVYFPRALQLGRLSISPVVGGSIDSEDNELFYVGADGTLRTGIGDIVVSPLISRRNSETSYRLGAGINLK